ncbi:hypothetical protein EVAR_56475_1 [Eumeta japonica]|uniref:Uncharacterized protein n=1 Tax=Eumeta variegata TaxID=151549 RepID=A0A4C1XLH4_EUMVA|nr:hypothetical protein EVAR_56475_1 [Eumeta japonica]
MPGLGTGLNVRCVCGLIGITVCEGEGAQHAKDIGDDKNKVRIETSLGALRVKFQGRVTAIPLRHNNIISGMVRPSSWILKDGESNRIDRQKERDKNNEQYYQLPDLFAVENYEKCLSQRQNAFCAGTFELIAAGRSPLYDLWKKLSINELENFNHTRIHRAVCLGPKTDCPIEGNLTHSFEECIDYGLLREYELNAKLVDFAFCRRSGESLPVDGVDKAFMAYLAVVVLLNLMGTAYHFFVKEKGSKGNRWVMAFSLFANWRRLTSPAEGGDPRLRNFACFNGINRLESNSDYTTKLQKRERRSTRARGHKLFANLQRFIEIRYLDRSSVGDKGRSKAYANSCIAYIITSPQHASRIAPPSGHNC